MPDNHARDVLVTGLKNAHAMENQALSILKPQLSRIEHYPEIAAKLDLHIRETRVQIRRLEEVLDNLAEDRSALKDMALSQTGTMAVLSHTMAGDEILKNTFANFAFEHFEIAAYRSLITVAEYAGLPALVTPLKANLEEEVAMAQWLDDNLGSITTKYLALRDSGATAKV